MKGLMKFSAETTLAALQKKSAASALVVISRRTVNPLIVVTSCAPNARISPIQLT
jgi:hypothetical protein